MAVSQVVSFIVSLSMVALSHRKVRLPAHPMTAALFREMVKEAHCNIPNVQVHRTAIFLYSHCKWTVMWTKLTL
jgi:hypothetical protein